MFSDVIISKAFPFPANDLDDAPDDLLRKFAFIDEDVVSDKEITVWKTLVGAVARKVALTTLRLKIQAGERVSPKTLEDLEVESYLRANKAKTGLRNLEYEEWKVDWEDPESIKRWYEGTKDTSPFREEREVQRRCFKIEMAMHEWSNWSPKTQRDVSHRLKELEDVGLNAADILSPGAGFCRNPDIPIVTPGSDFTAKFRLYNPGPTTWPPGCYGQYVKDHFPSFKGGGGEEVTNVIPHSVKPGEDVVLEVPLRAAPSTELDPVGYHCIGWRMKTPGGCSFGHYFYYEYAILEGWQPRDSRPGRPYRQKPTKEEVDEDLARQPISNSSLQV